ncbi:toll/interleukin-1 receptor domain-containing protein [Coleofasciculus sp.]|uniref:toll/interleukin-1 receptor domain-containing protein n=1 Tax=Coleofasciculus sp. TaxID=3100458 RepID=UPI003A46A753
MKAFISHSSIDKPFVERLATDLRSREGIDAWLDKWEILPGDRIPDKLEDGLTNAGILVLVLSPDSVNSQWVSYEKDAWLMAQVEEEKRAKLESRTPSRRLIPVLYKDCQKPFFVQAFPHISINDDNYEAGFQQLVNGMRRESGKPPLKGETTPAPVPASPPAQVSSGVMARILAFKLLKCLLPAQFDEVIFYYEIDESQLPMNVAQVQKAKEIIKLASQKEGESLSGLLDSIYQAAPHLKR